VKKSKISSNVEEIADIQFAYLNQGVGSKEERGIKKTYGSYMIGTEA
jgi:hypothetical protein